MGTWRSLAIGVLAMLLGWSEAFQPAGPTRSKNGRRPPRITSPPAGKGSGYTSNANAHPLLTIEKRHIARAPSTYRRKSRKKGDRARLKGRALHRSKRRLKAKVQDTGQVPDLSQMLREGLPYLSSDEATEVQLALAVLLYSYSRPGQEEPPLRVKAGVEVCLHLGRLGMGKDALLAAILSGVLRPGKASDRPLGFGRAPVTIEDLREGFGHDVARLVAGVEHVTCVEETANRILRENGGSVTTEGVDSGMPPPSEVLAAADVGAGKSRGRGRKRGSENIREASMLEQGEKLRNLIVSEAADWQVLTIRLAVQLQALKWSLKVSGGKAADQLARDALVVHGPLAHRLGVHQLRNELENTAFRRLFPDQFQEVRRATLDRGSLYEKILERTKEDLARALADTPAFMSQLEDEVVLQHRIKSPYSLWKKMRKKKVDVDGVLDAVALRVVLKARRWQGESHELFTMRSEDLCYQALSAIQQLFPVTKRELKDYVAYPKANGYQSLHTTQLVPDLDTHGPPVPMEFQVRTQEMHQRAEFGLAAHWSYKGFDLLGSESEALEWMSDSHGRSSCTNQDTSQAIVPESVTSGRELVDWLHKELRQRKVFVFGPDKRIWELDKSSATAADVLGRSYMKNFYEGGVVSPSGPAGRGRSSGVAWVNGQEVAPSYPLQNGDVFDVHDSTNKSSKVVKYRVVESRKVTRALRKSESKETA